MISNIIVIILAVIIIVLVGHIVDQVNRGNGDGEEGEG
jgi:hypothetical protein